MRKVVMRNLLLIFICFFCFAVLTQTAQAAKTGKNGKVAKSIQTTKERLVCASQIAIVPAQNVGRCR
jgi:hypothetical protein